MLATESLSPCKLQCKCHIAIKPDLAWPQGTAQTSEGRSMCGGGWRCACLDILQNTASISHTTRLLQTRCLLGIPASYLASYLLFLHTHLQSY